MYCSMKKSIAFLMGVASLFVFTGCAVQPRAILHDQAMKRASEDMDILSHEQEAPTHPVTLYEAMARAIRYNRERRVKVLETALSQHQFDLSQFDMLPKLTTQAGYTGRNPGPASYSESIKTGNVSLEPSKSQDADRRVSDVTFTWNILDFGLSYIRANQQANRHLIALEKERKAVQILISDVRRAWWEALSAQRLLKDIAPLEKRVLQALEVSRTVETKRLKNPLEALDHQRSLLQTLRTLQALKQDFSGIKARLATLMGLSKPGNLVLADPAFTSPLPRIHWELDTMERAALVLRPELNQAQYQQDISRQDVHAALLGVLPNVSLNAGLNWDSNSYLIDNSWLSYGTQISWNLFNVLRAPEALKAAEAKQDIAREQRLAISMVTLMQVHLALADHMDARTFYTLSRDYLQVQTRILKQVQARAGNTQGQAKLIQEELNFIVSQVRRDKAYAKVQDSFGRLLISMGIDPVPAQGNLGDIDALARGIKEHEAAWLEKDLKAYVAPILTQNPGNSDDA